MKSRQIDATPCKPRWLSGKLVASLAQVLNISRDARLLHKRLRHRSTGRTRVRLTDRRAESSTDGVSDPPGKSALVASAKWAPARARHSGAPPSPAPPAAGWVRRQRSAARARKSATWHSLHPSVAPRLVQLAASASVALTTAGSSAAAAAPGIPGYVSAPAPPPPSPALAPPHRRRSGFKGFDFRRFASDNRVRLVRTHDAAAF